MKRHLQQQYSRKQLFKRQKVNEIGDPIDNNIVNLNLGKQNLTMVISETAKTKFISSITRQRYCTQEFTNFLNVEPGLSQLHILVTTGSIKLMSISSILNNSGKKAIQAFTEFFNILFTKDPISGRYVKSSMLQALEKTEIKFSTLSSILHGSGIKATQAFTELFNILFVKDPISGHYYKSASLQALDQAKIKFSTISSILNWSGAKASQGVTEFLNILFIKDPISGQFIKSDILIALQQEKVKLVNISSILHGSGIKAAQAFMALFNILFIKDPISGQFIKSDILTTLKQEKVNLTTLSSLLHGSGVKISQAFMEFFNILFTKDPKSKQYIPSNIFVALKQEGIKLTTFSNMLHGSSIKTAQAFMELFNILFTQDPTSEKYIKSNILMVLQQEAIKLTTFSSILHSSSVKAAQTFMEFFSLFFTKDHTSQQYVKSEMLKLLEHEGINLTIISSVLHSSGAKAAQAFMALFSLFFTKDHTSQQYVKSEMLKLLEYEGINLTTIFSILVGSSAKANQSFLELFNICFTTINGQFIKSDMLKTLEHAGINLTDITNILAGSGAKIGQACIELFNILFTKDSTNEDYVKSAMLKALEQAGINLTNIVNILVGSGAKIGQAFIELFNILFIKDPTNEDYVKSAILQALAQAEIPFSTISSILYGSGAKISQAFMEWFNMLFTQDQTGQYLKSEKLLECYGMCDELILW